MEKEERELREKAGENYNTWISFKTGMRGNKQSGSLTGLSIEPFIQGS